MILIKFKGGLGNQLFQYAFGRRIAKLNKTSLLFDLDAYQYDKKRSFVLFSLNIVGRKATKKEKNKFLKYKNNYFYNFLNNKLPISRKKYIKENDVDIENFLKIKSNVYVDGYWQNEKYVKDIRGVLLKEFSFPLRSQVINYAKRIKNNSISIHIRRGDYCDDEVARKYHGCLSLEYYTSSFLKIANHNSEIFLFSDDIATIKKDFVLNNKIHFVSEEGFEDFEELYLMSLCTDNIISNSSFGWWGAYLNQNPKKRVVCPDKWYKKQRDIQGLIPENWIKGKAIFYEY